MHYEKTLSITEFITLAISNYMSLSHDDITWNEEHLLEGFIKEFITLYSVLYSNNLINVIQIFDIFNAKCYNKYTLKEVIY
jgi:hypothetical protein